MNRIATRTARPLITAGAALFAAAGTGAAAPPDEPVPADGATIVLNDGRLVGADDTVTLTFEGEKPTAAQGEFSASRPALLGQRFSAVPSGAERGGYAHAHHSEKKQLP
ncbi:hypothetical protein ACFC3O_25615 [Streptomyces sp. NPDC056007]|uniref:hypothetical protein n=1 Tax=Streptomyces sp. NPDC056007 TaxID=3345678 RepID=UPI0035D98385